MGAVSEPPLPSSSSSTSTLSSHENDSPNGDVESRQIELHHPHPTITTQLSLIPPSGNFHRHHRPPRIIRLIRTISRTLPILNGPKCRFPTSSSSAATIVPSNISMANSHSFGNRHRHHSHNIITGTIFGYRTGRVSFAIQETSRCIPSVVLELAMQTHALLLEMNAGAVRIAFETEKRTTDGNTRNESKLLDESLWTMFCNGKKSGYAVRREGSEEDLKLMEMLKAVTTGAGVLPGNCDVEGPEGEMAYVRAGFQHIIGSKDSETMYMISPEGDNGPDLTMFFVRL